MFVREDLSISQQACQAAHAFAEATRQHLPGGPHPTLVLCRPAAGCFDTWSAQILSEHSQLREAGPLTIWREPDLDNKLTAFAVGPVCTRVPFRHFSLWRPDHEPGR